MPPLRYSVLLLGVLILFAGCAGGLNADQSTDSPEPATSTPSSTATANGTVEVHFINVGQSVSTLIVSPEGETMLIDTGDFNNDGEYVLQYLQRHDIQRIDYLVTTHNDADHIGGNAAVIEYYETEADGIGAIYDPGIAASTQTYEEYLDAVERYEVTLYRTLEGDTIPMDGVAVQVLGPPQPYLENRARNENSIVLKLTYGETSFLFTGDAEDDQESHLVKTYGSQLQADVLKAGHHGSKTSTGGELLDAVDPSVVIISSAYDSRYGHPSTETLERLDTRSIPAYWTAVHGDIVLVSNGTAIDLRTQRDATTNPLSLRDEAAITPGSTDPVETRRQIAGDGAPVPIQDTATPDGTVVADGGVSLELTAVNADAEGDDHENLIDEYIVLTNTGSRAISMDGWTVSDAAGRSYTIPDGFTLDPGTSVTIHTGSGPDSGTDLYWDSGSPIWNNDGDTVIVRASDGTIVLEESY